MASSASELLCGSASKWLAPLQRDGTRHRQLEVAAPQVVNRGVASEAELALIFDAEDEIASEQLAPQHAQLKVALTKVARRGSLLRPSWFYYLKNYPLGSRRRSPTRSLPNSSLGSTPKL